MKMHTTNYQNTFIEVAPDCPLDAGKEPPMRGQKKSIANYQFEMVADNPYEFTSDEVMFAIYAMRHDIPESELNEAKRQFFAKGQPCFRASPLTKRYGWGVHSDDRGRVALYGVETEAYQSFLEDENIEKVKAMRSRK